MHNQIIVTVQGHGLKTSRKFEFFDPKEDQIVLSRDDKTLKAMVDQTLESFKDSPEKITITFKFAW